MLIGLSGGYCAGKNAVAALLEARGWACIDVDKLGHEALDLAKDTIVARFGMVVLRSDGSIDRRALARIVFSDPAALASQEAIIHPIAIKLLEEHIKSHELATGRGQPPKICINAALLHRTEHLANCDAIIEVRSPFVLRVIRGMRRDGGGMLASIRRIQRQAGFRAALYAAAHNAGKRVIILRNMTGKKSLERKLDAVLTLIEDGVRDTNH
jgi:dephospho-CoA kinase